MNKTNVDLSEIDTVILVGGLGIRLQSVLKDKPKCLAPINGRSFIDILLDDCINQGLRRFILCVGYLKEQVIEHLSNRDDCEIIYSEEEDLLGTGGAVKNAQELINSDYFLVLNGDSFIAMNFNEFINYTNDNYYTSTIVLTDRIKGSRYGNVNIDDGNLVTSFIEKNGSNGNRYVSAGVYCMNYKVLDLIPPKVKYSFESDLFPSLVNTELYGFPVKSNLIDIGTINSFHRAQSFFE